MSPASHSPHHRRHLHKNLHPSQQLLCYVLPKHSIPQPARRRKRRRSRGTAKHSLLGLRRPVGRAAPLPRRMTRPDLAAQQVQPRGHSFICCPLQERAFVPNLQTGTARGHLSQGTCTRVGICARAARDHRAGPPALPHGAGVAGCSAAVLRAAFSRPGYGHRGLKAAGHRSSPGVLTPTQARASTEHIKAEAGN